LWAKPPRPPPPTSSGPPPSAWAPPPTSSTAATAPCCPSPTTSSTSSAPPQQESEPAPFLGPAPRPGEQGSERASSQGGTGGIRAGARHTRPPPCADQRTAVPGRPGRHLRRHQPAGHRGAVRHAGG